MRPSDRDLTYVGHMRDIARKAVERAGRVTRGQFDRDEDLQMVLTHLIQTLGESARRVSAGFREAHPEIPWHQVIGMRHKIVHDYLDVDINIVWDVAHGELPKLLPTLEKLTPED